MTESITAAQFHDAGGVEDWRVLAHGACAHFRTGSFATGVRLVDAIGELADAANHHPDVDLRYAGVTVRLFTHDTGGVTVRDLALARQISAAARALNVAADPTAVGDIGITIEALVVADVLPFWRAVLGYQQAGDQDLRDPNGRWPSIRFGHPASPHPQRNRPHISAWVPHDHAPARVAAAITAGGHLVSDMHAPGWWTLADAEGNQVDVVTRSRHR